MGDWDHSWAQALSLSSASEYCDRWNTNRQSCFWVYVEWILSTLHKSQLLLKPTRKNGHSSLSPVLQQICWALWEWVRGSPWTQRTLPIEKAGVDNAYYSSPHLLAWSRGQGGGGGSSCKFPRLCRRLVLWSIMLWSMNTWSIHRLFLEAMKLFICGIIIIYKWNFHVGQYISECQVLRADLFKQAVSCLQGW